MTPVVRRLSCVSTLTALLLASLAAHADATAHVVETQPSGNATLGHQESFWVRIEYTSGEPISLWARPYRNGRQVQNAMSNASLTYQGSGEALGWFALTKPGEVDEVRISAGGGKPYREWELSHYPVQLSWTNAAPSDEPRAKWVEDLLATEKVRYQEDAQRRASEPVSVSQWAFFSGFMLVILGLFLAGLAVPVWSVWKWRGGWRIAAAVPACVVLFVVLRIIVDTARDPTSHNLWPFEILIFGSVALAIIGALKVARKYLGAEA